MFKLEQVKPALYFLNAYLDNSGLWAAAVVLVATASVACLTWGITFYCSQQTVLGEQGGKIPPTRPYITPFVGSLFSLLRSIEGCVSSNDQSNTIFGIKFLNHVVYIINGQQHVANLRKNREVVAPPMIAAIVSKQLFDIPSDSVAMYVKDTSGPNRVSAPDSDVPSHNRIDFLQTEHYHRNLGGKSLATIFEKFHQSWLQDPQLSLIDDRWQSFPDIFLFWTLGLTDSLNTAIVGPILLQRNKHFSAQLIEFFLYTTTLLKYLPKIYAPRAFELRESLFRDVRAWQDQARTLDQQRTTTDSSSSGWGSTLMQERQDFMPYVDNWDKDAVAKADLGLIWGANINVHPMSVWALVNVFKNPSVLSRLRKELELFGLEPVPMSVAQHNEELLQLPYLHAVYLECLRLHAHTFAVFYTQKGSVKINEWEIPKGHLVMAPTQLAQMDESVWNTDNGRHPVSTFWPDRFLVYSGSEVKVAQKMADSMFPYGLGKKICPGKRLSQKIIKAVCAHVVTNFDLEILTKESEFPTDPRFYGFGTSRPLHKIPFKVRRKKAA